MRRSWISAVVATLIASPAIAQGDAALIERFEATEAELLALVDGLTAQQWGFKPAADRWSVAEVVEHIVVAEKATWEVLMQQLTEKSVTDAERRMAEGFEQQVSSTLRDRTQRFDAPPDFEPTGRWATGAEVVGMFKEVRGAMIMFLKNADFDLRTRAAPNPTLGTDVDAHGWALIAVEHGSRHMDQIREVMGDADYPG